MRIERHSTGWWVIVRGDENRPQFFSFFVDADRSTWSKWLDQAARYRTYEAAAETATKLRQRAQLRRTALKAEREDVL